MSQVVRIDAQRAAALDLIQRHYPNYHPVLAMVQLAHREDVLYKDPKLEFEIHKAVAPYCEARLSSLEVTPPKQPGRVVVSLFEDMELEDGRTVPVEIPLVREITEIVPLDAD